MGSFLSHEQHEDETPEPEPQGDDAVDQVPVPVNNQPPPVDEANDELPTAEPDDEQDDDDEEEDYDDDSTDELQVNNDPPPVHQGNAAPPTAQPHNPHGYNDYEENYDDDSTDEDDDTNNTVDLVSAQNLLYHQRQARQRLIQEQNAAFEESLRIDRAKELAKRTAQAEKEREEANKLAAQQRLKIEQEQVLQTLIPEPAKDSTQPICYLKCRLPGGAIVSRRFLKTSTLQDLIDFLFTEGYAIRNFKLLVSHPKKDITIDYDGRKTIGSIFCSQDTLFLEERLVSP